AWFVTENDPTTRMTGGSSEAAGPCRLAARPAANHRPAIATTRRAPVMTSQRTCRAIAGSLMEESAAAGERSRRLLEAGHRAHHGRHPLLVFLGRLDHDHALRHGGVTVAAQLGAGHLELAFHGGREVDRDH